MWHASVGWMTRAIDTAMLNGSVSALLAYSLLHSYEMLAFVRCRLVGWGQCAGH
jgi:hypothetical protein